MAKYKVKDTNLLHDGEFYPIGSVMILSEVPIGLSPYLEPLDTPVPTPTTSKRKAQQPAEDEG